MKKVSVLNGIDRIDEYFYLLDGLKIGLITNPTGRNKDFKETADILAEKGLLKCLFSPEHGVRGGATAGAHISDCIDEKTGVPSYSLYGASLHIRDEVLKELDAVAFDIQDVGARFYTYIYTLSYAMEDCVKAGKRFIVFDRINPVGGACAQGSVLDRKFSSFVGRYPIATRHGFTVGEFARFINEVEGIGCDLTVIPVKGWTREIYFDDTDLIFIPPSPNIPTVESCFAYLATCLFEGTNVSEGRGTAKPFEFIGAPWLDHERICEEMNALKLSGVKFRPCFFTPTASKHANTECKGIQLHITDRRSFNPFESGLHLLDLIRKTHVEFEFIAPYSQNANYFIDLLLGSDELRRDGFDVDEFLKKQNEKLKEYTAKIEKFYLY
ncbi:MAG: DUF1343 domain-containing protein [Clostridia bacterium]|nr:DUF1343 domain-containing protein [Clostridia bacterium]